MTQFTKLNHEWNADPNAPMPEASLAGTDLVLSFRLNTYQFPQFRASEIGYLHFHGAWRCRFGVINDEGWYLGQCRFSKLAPEWGEFYEVHDDLRLNDWHTLRGPPKESKHYLFYFRDEEFECDASGFTFEHRNP